MHDPGFEGFYHFLVGAPVATNGRVDFTESAGCTFCESSASGTEPGSQLLLLAVGFSVYFVLIC